jgi:hypothetical protein
LPPSHSDCLESLGSSTSWSPNGMPRPVMGQLYHLHSKALGIINIPSAHFFSKSQQCSLAPTAIQTPVEVWDSSLLQNVQAGSSVHRACLMDTGIPSRVWSGRGVKLTTSISADVKTRGAIPLLPLYAILAWRGTALPLIVMSVLIRFVTSASMLKFSVRTQTPQTSVTADI